MAYLLFNRVGVFRDSLKNSNPWANNLNTFDEFEIFMRNEHAALDMVGGLTVKDSSLDQAKMLRVL